MTRAGQTLTNVAGNVIAASDATIPDFMNYFQINLMNPRVIVGAFIGAMAAFLFCGMTMEAVGRAAEKMVQEVRRQFREIAGILEGTGTPDYGRCVEISTRAAQHEMIVPSILAILIPILVGIILGVAGVMGLLVGGLAGGFTLAVFMANAGGAWDNAKKNIEEGNFGGKGSFAHKACIVGDTVGDPFKDTSGPSLNILIKLMSMVSIVMAGLTVAPLIMKQKSLFFSLRRLHITYTPSFSLFPLPPSGYTHEPPSQLPTNFPAGSSQHPLHEVCQRLCRLLMGSRPA